MDHLQKLTAEKLAALPEMLDAKQVARLVGVCTKTIRTWSRDGRFPDPEKFSRKTHRWSKRRVLEHLFAREGGEQP